MQETKLKERERIKGSIKKEEQKAEKHEKEEFEKQIERIKEPEEPSIPEIIAKEPYKPKTEVVEKIETIEDVLKAIEDLKRNALDSHYYPDRVFYSKYEANLKKLEKLGYPHVEDLRKELIEKVEENIKRDKERYLKVRELIQKYREEKNLKKFYCLWMWLCHLKSDDAVKNLKIKFDEKEEEAEKIFKDLLTDLDNCGIKETDTFVYTGVVHINAYELTLANKAIEKLLKEEGIFDFFVNDCDRYIKKLSELLKKAVYFFSRYVNFSYYKGEEYVSARIGFKEILRKFSSSEEDVEKELMKSGILLKKVERDFDAQIEIPSYAKPVLKRIKEDPYSFGIEETKEIEEEVKEEIKKIAEIQEETAAEISVGEAEKEELFELFIKSSTGHFPKSLNTKKPLVIILSKSDDDNYASALQIICKELFHELIGGLPTSIIRSKGKKDIEEDLRAENRIEFIDDSKTKYFKPTFSKIKTLGELENNVDWEEIGKRLNEFFTQGFGFVIFQIPENFIQEFKRKLEEVTGDLKPQIMELSPQYIGRRVIDLAEPKDIDLIKLKRDISSAIWGFVIPKGDSRWSEGETFDNFFTACENEFHERLNKIGRTEIKVGDKKLPPSFLVNIGENESDLHYWMKVFIVKYLIEKENYEKDAIKTEEDAKFTNSKGREVKPDIKVNSKVIEVETLYRTGLEYHEPLNKVTETIKRYKDENLNVWVVLKNLDLFFYHKDLKRLKKSAKEEWNVDVKFFGLDLDKEELVPIDKFVKPVKLSIKTEGG